MNCPTLGAVAAAAVQQRRVVVATVQLAVLTVQTCLVAVWQEVNCATCGTYSL
jgi:hypothetical protein